MGQPIKVTVALDAADADGISASQTVPAAGTLAINGALAAGDVVDNICLAQTASGAGNLTLNGALVSGGVARVFNKAIQIVSAGDDTGVTFTIYGIGPDGYSSQMATVTGSDTSVVATTEIFYSISRISVDGATADDVTVGTNGTAVIADLGSARQILLTFGTDDTGNSYTITGTNAAGNPLVEVVAGDETTATTVNHFQSVTNITAAGASAGTVTVGTNGIGSSEFVSINYHAQPVNISAASVTSGTVSYTLQWTYDDPNVTVPQTWFDDATATSKSANFVTVMNDPVFGGRVVVNSFTAPGSVTTTYIQAGIVGQ